MNTIRDPFRILGFGLIWGLLWPAVAITAGSILGILRRAEIDPGESPIALAPTIAAAGFVCGVIAGILVSLFERQTSTRRPAWIRVGAWGFLVAAGLPLVLDKGLPELVVTGPLGAVSALLSAAILPRRFPFVVQSDGDPS